MFSPYTIYVLIGLNDTWTQMWVSDPSKLKLQDTRTLYKFWTHMRTHHFIYGSCNFKLIFEEYAKNKNFPLIKPLNI